MEVLLAFVNELLRIPFKMFRYMPDLIQPVTQGSYFTGNLLFLVSHNTGLLVHLMVKANALDR